jgi:hypothetical protein
MAPVTGGKNSVKKIDLQLHNPGFKKLRFPAEAGRAYGPGHFPGGFLPPLIRLAPANMGAPGNRISEFGTVYGNFVFHRFQLPAGRKAVSLSSTGFPSFAACFLREVFGKCSGRLREFPNTSRRNLEETPDTTGRQTRYPACPPPVPKSPEKKFPYTVPNSEIPLPARRIFAEDCCTEKS